jgi:hypothetical protein
MPRKNRKHDLLGGDDTEESASEPRLPRKSRFEIEPDTDATDDAGEGSDRSKRREERRRKKADSDPSQPLGDVPEQEGNVDVDDPNAEHFAEKDNADSSSPMLKRGRNNNRFNKEESEPLADTSANLGGASILSVRSNEVPWIALNQRLSNERQVLFQLHRGDRTRMSTKTQSSMRDQGLYISRFSKILSYNIDRAILRARVHSSIQPLQNQDSSENLVTSLRSSLEILKDDLESPLRSEEMIFVIPFEPFKDRACRPSMRYDPSLPYLQYG